MLALLSSVLSPPLLLLSSAPRAHARQRPGPDAPDGLEPLDAFGCNVSEALVEQTADYLVSSWLKDGGNQYVNIDDCWITSARNSAGQLVPDPVKFPDGISGTAAYVHSKGLGARHLRERRHRHLSGIPGQSRP